MPSRILCTVKTLFRHSTHSPKGENLSAFSEPRPGGQSAYWERREALAVGAGSERAQQPHRWPAGCSVLCTWGWQCSPHRPVKTQHHVLHEWTLSRCSFYRAVICSSEELSHFSDEEVKTQTELVWKRVEPGFKPRSVSFRADCARVSQDITESATPKLLWIMMPL